MADYSELANTLIDLVGGKRNIQTIENCVTRLRLNVVDAKKVRINDIKKVKGVLGAQFSGTQFQIIIGNNVSDVCETIKAQLGKLSNEATNEKKKGNFLTHLMEILSGIFTPTLSALIGAGLLKGTVTLLVTFNLISVKGDTYQILNMIGDAAFYFLPFILAVSSAKKFKTNEYLALCVAGVLLYPTMVDGFNGIVAGESVTHLMLFGILPVPYLAYTSSVIPIILATYFLSRVHAWIKGWMPEMVSLMFTPMITLLLVVPVTLVVLGPLGTYIGAGLSIIILWLFEHLGILAGALVGTFYPFLVITGMHWALIPLIANNFSEFGYDASLSPIMLAATFAMAGATFGVFFQTKKQEMKQISLSAGLSAKINTYPNFRSISFSTRFHWYKSCSTFS